MLRRIYKAFPHVRKSKHLVQLWYLNRQRHCLSQSQRLRYIVSGKSHSKQCRGQETPLLQPRCTLKWSPGCPPLDDAFGYNHLRGHLRLSHFFFFFSWVKIYVPPLLPPPHRHCPEEEGSLRICAERKHLKGDFNELSHRLPAHMSSNKFLFIIRMFWPSHSAPCMPVL